MWAVPGLTQGGSVRVPTLPCQPAGYASHGRVLHHIEVHVWLIVNKRSSVPLKRHCFWLLCNSWADGICAGVRVEAFQLRSRCLWEFVQ